MGPQSQSTLTSGISSHLRRCPQHWTRTPAIWNGLPIDTLAI